MAKGTHERAVDLALRANDDLGVLFDRLGVGQERSKIHAAYATAHKALRGEIENGQVVEGVLATLRDAIETRARASVREARQLGEKNVTRALALYGIEPGGDEADDDPLVAAWLAALDEQSAAIRAVALTTGDELLVLGDDDRAGILTPGPLLLAGAQWMVGAFVLGWLLPIPRATRDEFYKQAVAAIDARTTECCLRVHGQVQPMNKPFVLTGTPRYADRLDWPPFHYYCRTASALVSPEDANDGLTGDMIAAARAELKARSDGSRIDIHPADATSRR